jgi:hypothetical protein
VERERTNVAYVLLDDMSNLVNLNQGTLRGLIGYREVEPLLLCPTVQHLSRDINPTTTSTQHFRHFCLQAGRA